jgi:gliding motility-associated-like protein
MKKKFFFNILKLNNFNKGLLYGIFIAVLFFIENTSILGQTASNKNNWVNNNPYEQPVFIENVGQFNANQDVNNYLNDTNNTVHYVASNDGVDFIFTSTGLLYRYFEEGRIKEKIEKEEHHEKREKEKEKFPKGKSHFLKMEWVGANTTAKIVAEKKVFNYFTYPNPKGGTIVANAFAKITYKNMYPFIDIEYVFQENKRGIKYSIILHPGANPNQLQVKFDGTEGITKDRDGNIIIRSDFGDFKEYAPISFYEDNTSITSAFVVNKNTVAFTLDKKMLSPEGFVPKEHTLIIDPWVLTPTVPVANKVFEIGKDTLNNVYIFGGTSDASVQKYNSAGVLQWTYNTGWDGTVYYGDMAVSANGLIYLSGLQLPFGTVVGVIKKIDNTGNQLWYANTGTVANGENWRCVYNCDYSKLLVADNWGESNVYAIDVATNVVGPVIGTYNGSGEIRALTRAFNGNFYALTLPPNQADTLIPHQLKTLNSSFLNTNSIPSGIDLSYSGIQYNVFGGQNAISTNESFTYTTDGYNLFKRDINTGTLVASNFIPNGIPEQNSGIDVDDCGNVYCGSQSKVYKFNSSLALVDSASTPAAVYDLTLGENGEIFACGNGFLTSLNMATCPIISCACVLPQTTNANCNGDNNGTATINTSGVGPFTYLWSNGQTTPTATGLSVGTYSVTVTSGSGCVTSSEFKISAISAIVVPITNPTVDSNCEQLNDGTAVVVATPGSGPYTYEWSTIPVQTNDTAVGLSGNYSVIITDTYGCKDTANASIIADGTPEIFVYIDNFNCTPQIGVFSSSINASDYTYLWSTGSTQNSIYVDTSGTYSYTVTSSNQNNPSGCMLSITGTVTIDSVPTIWTVSSIDTASSCNSNGGSITIHLANASSGSMNYYWADDSTFLSSSIPPIGDPSSNVLSNLAPGVYYCYLYDYQYCKDTLITVEITNGSFLSIGVNTPPAICAGESVNLTANGANSYTWNPPTGLNTATGASVIATPTTNTTYTVTGTTGTCSGTSSSTVIVHPVYSLDAGANLIITAGETVILTASGNGSYLWNTGQTTSSITVSPAVTTTYYVSLTDINGCLYNDSVRLEVEINCMEVNTPNVYTPNQDGLNDLFGPSVGAGCLLDEYSFLLYNRWGVLLFESHDISTKWNGKHNNSSCSEGVYYYLIEYTFKGDTKKSKQGFVYLFK